MRLLRGRGFRYRLIQALNGGKQLETSSHPSCYPAQLWPAEREYWHKVLKDWYLGHYGVFDPVQTDPQVVPSVDIVGVTQFPHMGTPDGFFGTGYRHTLAYLQELHDHGWRPDQMNRILEFGVGFGRLLLHYFPFKAELFGVDVTEKPLSWTKKTLGGRAKLELTGLQPPLPFDTGFFDYLYAQSVFTHIPCKFVRPWIDELARILRPGGAAIISFFDPNVFFSHHPYCQFHRDMDEPGCVDWEHEKGVRMTTYLSRKTLVELWSPKFEILELRSHFRDQCHLVMRRR